MSYIIKLGTSTGSGDFYCADFKGDPGRTFELSSARKFDTIKSAMKELIEIRVKYNRGFKVAEILKLKEQK